MTSRTLRIAKGHGQRRALRSGFTLVELLIAMMILSALAALAVTTYINSTTTARVRKTQNLIATLNNAIEERIEGLRKEGIKVGDPFPGIHGFTCQQLAELAGGAGNAGARQTAKQRAEVLAYVALLTKALPQQFYDIAPFDISYPAGQTNLTQTQPALGGFLLREYQKNLLLDDEERLSEELLYDDDESWEVAFFPDEETLEDHGHTGHEVLHDPDSESAECLYLILSAGSQYSSIGIADIPTEFIADTDNDGLMEIVDAWGKPLRFYRFPTDYYAYMIEVTGELPANYLPNSIDPQGLLIDGTWFADTDNPNYRERLETAGLFRVHKAYATRDPESQPVPGDIPVDPRDPTKPMMYPTKPLIISAGPDMQFGLWTPYSTSANSSTRAIPKPAANNAVPAVPYLYSYFRGARPDPAELEYLGDNITNVQLPGVQGSN